MSSNIIIDNTLPYTQSIASAGQTQFDTNWTSDNADDILVYARASGVEANETTQLISSSNYNVTFVGAEEFVRVTFLSGRTLNDIITISRSTPIDRENLYTNTNFTPSMLNDDFGRTTLMEQEGQLYNKNLTPRYNIDATIQANIDTLLPLLPAGYGWRKNDAGTAIEIVRLPDDIAPSNATYVTLTDETANLPKSYPLSTISSGLMINKPNSNDILARTLVGTSNQITVTNPDGLSGNPTISIADNPIIGGSAGMGIPQGTTAQRVTPTSGIGLRFNTDFEELEFYIGGVWLQIEANSDPTNILALLASHLAGAGASLIGLEDQGSVTNKTVQDLANAGLIAKTNNGTLVNGQFLGNLSSGILKNTTTTGNLSISAPLTSIDALTTSVDKMIYTTASNTYATTTLTSFMRTLLDDPDAATARATLGITNSTKNLIIGGNFDTNPWQRGTSFTNPTIVYTADRWLINRSDDAEVDIDKEADAPTVLQSGMYSQYSLKASVTTADTSIAAGQYYTICQSIEGYNFVQIAQRQFTLSFWVKASKTGTYCVAFANAGNDRSYIAEYTVNLTNTWEYKTITVSASPSAGTWDYTNDRGIRLYFTLASGSTYQTSPGIWQSGNYLASSNQVNALDTIGNTFQVQLVQIESGSTATPFEIRLYATELALCQRYTLVCTSSNYFDLCPFTWFYSTKGNGVFLFPVPMRAIPSSIYTGTTSNFKMVGSGIGVVPCSNVSGGNVATSSYEIDWDTASSNPAGQAGWARLNNDATLTFTAEI